MHTFYQSLLVLSDNREYNALLIDVLHTLPARPCVAALLLSPTYMHASWRKKRLPILSQAYIQGLGIHDLVILLPDK